MKKTFAAIFFFTLAVFTAGFVPFPDENLLPESGTEWFLMTGSSPAAPVPDNLPSEITAEPIDLSDEWHSVPVIKGGRSIAVNTRRADSTGSAGSVDGISFTISQFRNHAVFLRFQYLDSYTRNAEEFLSYGISLGALNDRFEAILGPAGKKDLLKEAADHLIFARIFETEGTKAGLEFTDEEIAAELAELIDLPEGGDPALQIETKYRGLITREFTEHIALLRLYEKALLEKAAEEYRFEEETVDLRHILVEDKETAREILTKLEAGGSWDELAAAYSMDTYTREDHGALGRVRRDEIDDTLAEAAFALEPGSISGPIQTDFGFHILASDGKAMTPLEGSALEEAQQNFYYDTESSMRKAHTVLIDISACLAALPEDPVFLPIEEELSDPPLFTAQDQ